MQAPRWSSFAYLRASPRASRNSFMIIRLSMPQNMPRSELASTYMNGRPASPAMQPARNVLPVPGRPDRSMPLGISPPAAANAVSPERIRTVLLACSRRSGWPRYLSKVRSIWASSGVVTYFRGRDRNQNMNPKYATM